MASLAKGPPITIEQYESFEGYPGLRDELIHGEIVMSPQPKPFHQQVSDNVRALLDEAIRHQPYVARQNTNIKFGQAHSMPAPDVFIVGRDAWKRACQLDEYLSQAPLLVVEVVSPANRRARVEEKARLYLSQGVAMVWIVYPKRKVVLVHRAGQDAAIERTPAHLLELPDPLVAEIPVQGFFVI